MGTCSMLPAGLGGNQGSCVPLVRLFWGIFPTDASESSLIVETSCLGIYIF